MKFTNDLELQNYLNQLMDENELNLSLSDLFSSLIGNREISTAKEINALSQAGNHNRHEVFLSKVIDYLDIDLSYEDNEEIFNNRFLNCIQKIDVDKYLSNPYYQKFKDVIVKEGKYELVIDKYLPYELFAYKDMDIFEHTYVEKNSLAYFEKEYDFLALNQNGVTWMSVTPNEIETMEHALELVSGDITIFGLGLGYFAYMASNKKEVNKITIIENDKTIIKLFNKYLLPHFENKQKIEIIDKNAINFIKNPINSQFSFVDLWHNPFDGLELFVTFKKAEKHHPDCKFLYWLESSFYLLLRRCMFALIGEQLEHFKDDNYIHADNYLDKVINTYYFKTKSLTISSKAQLDELLSDKSLINLLLDD